MSLSISVIVPVKNGRETLPAALHSLTAQSGLKLGEDYEVIVVDDGSEDGTAQVVPTLPGLRVITQPNAGPASARNSGAQAGLGQILAFTDADCIPSATWLTEMIRPFEDPRTCGVKGVYRTREPGLVPRFVQAEFEERYQVLSRFEHIDFIDTYSAAYRTKTFLQAGGFDTSYPVPSVEDQELSFRLARDGARLVFQPAAFVYHRHDLTPFEYAKRKFGIGFWKARMLRRMPERAFKDTYTPQTLRIQIGLTALLCASLCAALAWTPLLFVAAACLGAFLLTTRSFYRQAVTFDPGLSLVILPMLLLRAISLGSGLVVGLAASLRDQK